MIENSHKLRKFFYFYFYDSEQSMILNHFRKVKMFFYSPTLFNDIYVGCIKQDELLSARVQIDRTRD